MANSSFQLNLLPWRETERYQSFSRALFILLFSVMSSILIGLVLNVYLSLSYKELVRSISMLQVEKSVLDTELLQVSTLMQDIQRYQNLSLEYARQQDENLQYLNSLNEIAIAIPVNSWLTQLSYQTNQWRLIGKSEKATDVEAFIVALRNTQTFQQIMLERLELATYQQNSAETSPQFSYALIQSKEHAK